MNDNARNRLPTSGPFHMGRQGHLIIAVIILGSTLFAATRDDWATMLISALVLPLVMVALIHLLSRLWRDGTDVHNRRQAPMQDMGVLTFLARTNPFMFLLFGALSRGVDDERYQDLLQSGPYGMGQHGYLLAFLIFFGPLILTVIITAVTGQLPAHSGPHFPSGIGRR